MIIIAGMRLAKTAKNIETDTEVASTGARFDLALAVLIGLLGASLLLYMSHAVCGTSRPMSFAHATAIRPTREEAHDLLAPIYGWFTEALRHARSEIGQGGAACAFHHVRR
jgi:hypothetical protein